MKKTIARIVLSQIAASVLIGCTVVKTRQTATVSPDGTETRITDFTARTILDAHNDLAKAKTSMTEKSQGVTIAGLDQESSGSNVVSIAEAVARGAVKGAVEGAK